MKAILEKPPRFATLPAHERVQLCEDEWAKVLGAYILHVVRHGLHFKWILGMDRVNSDPVCSPRTRLQLWRKIHS